MMRLLQLGTNVKFSSQYVLGPCISAHSRTAISTYSLWDVRVYSLVCSSVGFCRWDITNGIIRTVEFVHRLWFKMKIETLSSDIRSVPVFRNGEVLSEPLDNRCHFIWSAVRRNR